MTTDKQEFSTHDEVCGNCYYSEPKKKEWLFCYRYPPTQIRRDEDTITPDVHCLRRACGEFRNKNITKVFKPNDRK